MTRVTSTVSRLGPMQYVEQFDGEVVRDYNFGSHAHTHTGQNLFHP